MKYGLHLQVINSTNEKVVPEFLIQFHQIDLILSIH